MQCFFALVLACACCLNAKLTLDTAVVILCCSSGPLGWHESPKTAMYTQRRPRDLARPALCVSFCFLQFISSSQVRSLLFFANRCFHWRVLIDVTKRKAHDRTQSVRRPGDFSAGTKPGSFKKYSSQINKHVMKIMVLHWFPKPYTTTLSSYWFLNYKIKKGQRHHRRLGT